MAADPHDITLLAKTIDNDLPRAWRSRPGGRTGRIELALIEAVLSVRARGGRTHHAAGTSAARWSTERNTARPDDLRRLAMASPVHLAAVLDSRQILPGGLPASWAITHAARNLAYAGVRRAADLAQPSPAHRRAFTAVPGLGPATWAHFLMLLGVNGTRPDARTVRYVREALGRAVTSTEARHLLDQAAAELEVSPPTLLRALWHHTRLFSPRRSSRPV
ncbi:hypothetical protein G1H11_13825 [Phytoactinopolyspora alkaliphila]|uniref:Uncharacterized protein n=1 Tax=Phytoactinopolyspora alkaliphila TaxID=1783498 RepID=A0A6N9YN69_9ACTN|nr:hypothetical protein [Phytoactinopolyspora alkaliphila]NED96385.1 hypothetical protein [Phytoactinopolyspora alkaliphila]